MVENPYPLTQTAPRALALTQDQTTKELQIALTVAHQINRDPHAAMAGVLEECSRPVQEGRELLFAYKMKDQLIREPNIRLAEIMCQHWQHVRYGWREIERETHHSVVTAYAWDLCANNFASRDFFVPHIRDTKTGPKPIQGTREVYEHVANFAMRRVRACILAVLPRPLKDAATAQCLQTMQNSIGHADIGRLIAAYRELGITKSHIETYLGRPLQEATTEQVADLRTIYRTIRDGEASPEDYFTDEQKSNTVIEIDGRLFSPNGQPYNPEIHSPTKNCTRTGDWRRRRGIEEDMFTETEQADRDALSPQIRGKLREHGIKVPAESEAPADA